MVNSNRMKQLAHIVYDVIGAGIEVHKVLGYGISEGIYEEALSIELSELGYNNETQCDLPTFYKGILLEKRFRLDMVVEDDIIIELKAVEKILPEHRAQLFNYMRLTNKPIGILANFGKNFYVEKYIYDEQTNEISFFQANHNGNDHYD